MEERFLLVLCKKQKNSIEIIPMDVVVVVVVGAAVSRINKWDGNTHLLLSVCVVVVAV